MYKFNVFNLVGNERLLLGMCMVLKIIGQSSNSKGESVNSFKLPARIGLIEGFVETLV